MRNLPPTMPHLLAPFAPCFSRRVWGHAVELVVGALLTPGKRTMPAALRVLGLALHPRSECYHRVLNRATWSGLAASPILLGLLVTAMASDGPLIIGMDETLERRRGSKYPHTGTWAKGIYRDPVRSSRTQFVTSRVLRWICLLLLAPIPWAGRVWALPFLTILAPLARYDQTHHRQHKTLIDWSRQLLPTVRRWHPGRCIVAVADSTDAALDLLAACRTWATRVIAVMRFRLDAALYAPALPRRPGHVGRPRLKGPRLPTPARVAGDPMTVWTSLTVASWYGRGERSVEIFSATAVWYHDGFCTSPGNQDMVQIPRAFLDRLATSLCYAAGMAKVEQR